MYTCVTPVAALELYKFIDIKDNRKNLHRIRIAPSSISHWDWMVEATDGRTAVRLHWGHGDMPIPGDAEFFLTYEAAKAAAKLGLPVVPDSSMVDLSGKPYPNFGHVWPTTDTRRAAPVLLDPSLLTKICRHAKRWFQVGRGKKITGLRAEVCKWDRGGEGPTLWSVECYEMRAEYVIMPLRG